MANQIEFSVKVNGTDQVVTEVNKVTNSVDNLNKTSEKTKAIKANFGQMGAGMAESFSNAQGAIAEFGIANDNVVEGIKGGSIAMRAASGITKGWTVIQTAFNAVLNMNPVMKIVTAVGLLVTGIIALWGPIQKLGEKFTWIGTIINGLKASFNIVRDFVSDISGGLIDDTATAKTKSNAEEIIAAYEDIGSEMNKLKQQREEELELLEAQGVSEEELHAKREENMKADLADLETKMQAYKDAEQETTEEAKKTASAISKLKNDLNVLDAKYDTEKKKRDKASSDEAIKNAEEVKTKKEKIDQEELDRKKEFGKGIEKAQSTINDLVEQYFLLSTTDEVEKAKLAELIAYKKVKDAIENEADATRKLAITTAETNDLIISENMALSFAKQLLIKKLEDIDTAALTKKQEQEEEAYLKEKDRSEQRYQDAMAAIDFGIAMKEEGYLKELEIADRMNMYELEENQRLYDLELINFQQYSENYNNINERLSNARREIYAQEITATLDATAYLFSAIADSATQGTKKWKNLKIAETIISGLSALIKTWEGYASMGPWGAALAAIQTAGIIAATASSVSKIKNTKVDDSDSSSKAKVAPSKFSAGGLVEGQGSSFTDSVNSMLAPNESVINARSTAMFGNVLSAINQAGGGVPINTGGNSSPVIKAYVVSSEMTSQQEADKKVRDLARI